jgi:type VI secretion system protein ImpG
MARRYYEEEMQYLYEAGKAFAQVHPEQAGYLNVDSLTDRDPYVERLFEGFAFLTGRIRERLDDEMPRYTESLFRLLHPHFVQPVPALSIIECSPRPGMVQETTILEAGTEVRSSPVGDEGAVCRFTTTAPVPLQPMRLEAVKLEWPDENHSTVHLHLQLDRGIEYKKLDLKKLRLFFYAEPSTASAMHLFFTRHASGLTYRMGEQSLHLRGQEWIQPVGLDGTEHILPRAPQSFSGFRLLQEYFCFRPRFWFVDVRGFDRFEPSEGGRDLQLEITFDRPYPEDRVFKNENIRLFCAPVINLFNTDAEPIRLDHRVSEYRVIGDVQQQNSMSVYDVVDISGIEENTGRRRSYRPFFAFTHENDTDGYYVETARPGPNGDRHTYVSIGGRDTTVEELRPETLSLELRCTNGDLPNEMLQEGSITRFAPGVANLASVSNLTQPTPQLPPPTGEDRQFLWRMISHLSLNYRSVATREALVGLLQLYDWTDTAANRRRIAGIQEVSWDPKETTYRGSIIRGAEITIDVDAEHFAGEGDLSLFGTVMSTFLSMYATMNSFIHLTIVSRSSGRRYEWTPRSGTRPNV